MQQTSMSQTAWLPCSARERRQTCTPPAHEQPVRGPNRYRADNDDDVDNDGNDDNVHNVDNDDNDNVDNVDDIFIFVLYIYIYRYINI